MFNTSSTALTIRRLPWAVIGWGTFIVAHAHPKTTSFALPVLLLCLIFAERVGQLDLISRLRPLETAILGFGLSWSVATVFALDPSRAVLLSVPTVVTVLCALVLPRSESRQHFLSFDVTLLSLSIPALSACLEIVATGSADDPMQRLREVDIPWLVVPNDIAWLSCLWPLWWRGMNAPSPSRQGWILLLVVSCLLVVAMMILESRLGLAALAIAIAGELAFKRFRISRSSISAMVLIGVAVLLGFSLFKGWTSSLARLQLWQTAIELFLQHPILGTGPHNFTLHYSNPDAIVNMIDPRITPWPHNLPLELLSSGGALLGLAAAAVLKLRYRRFDDRLPGSSTLAFTMICLFEASTLRLWLGLCLVLLLVPPSPRFTSSPTLKTGHTED